MENLPFQELETERLYLRGLQESDWPEISFLRTDSTVNKWVKRPSATTKAEALNFISNTLNGAEEGKFYYWVICLKDEPKMIGSICFWNFNTRKDQAELGYDLHPKHQGLGIMNEALLAVLEFGKDVLNLHTVEAFTHNNNKPSAALLIRNGFKLNDQKRDPENEYNRVFELYFFL